MRRTTRALVAGLFAMLVASQAASAETVKIGFITSLSGPAGVIGKHMQDSVELALDHLGRKVGGLETEVIYGDDQRKPDVGKQLADEMLKKHRVQFVSGKSAADAVKVDCATCHRGVPVPKPLRDLVLESTVREGPDAAAKLYRDLRAKYYGSQSYDFSEQTLITVTDRLAQSRPDAAIVMADLNLEFYPKSWRSYLAKGIAQSRRLDTTPDAVASFRKALEIDPDNGVVQGWLAQTEPVARRVR